MLSGLLAPDLALDLGSARTRLHQRGSGIVADVPTVVAVRTWRSGRREVIATGEEARAMLGRTPDGVRAIRPVRAGALAEPEVAAAFLRHLLATRLGHTGWGRPTLSIAVARDAAPADRRALSELGAAAGAREVRLVPAPLAAARGAELAVEGADGHMIVDVGAGATDIAVLCMGEVVVSTTLDVAGEVFDGAVVRLLRRGHALLVGGPTAERVKHQIGAALDAPEATLTVAGRCLRRGVPRSVDVASDEVCDALREPVAAIGAGIRRVLEQTPPEIASDVVDHGVILCGGGSLLRNLDLALRADTGLAMLPVDAPAGAVIRGVALTPVEPVPAP